jgi:hypothetical protein
VKTIDTDTANTAQSTLLGGLGLDEGWRVSCDADGTCSLFGTTHKSFGESTDYLMIRLDSNKMPLWARTFGGTNKDELQGVIDGRDGGYLLFGPSQSLFYTPLKAMSPSRIPRPLIVKLDHVGRVEWAKLVQFNDAVAQTAFFAAVETLDGGFVLVGHYGYLKNPTDKKWSPDMFALKLAADGKTEWMHRYHLDADYGIASAVTSMPDGRIAIAAAYFDDAGDQGLLTMTLSPDGSPVQVTEFPGPFNPFTLAIQADGEALVAGSYDVKGKPQAAFTLSLDEKGAEQFGHIYSLRNPDNTPLWVGSFSLRNVVVSHGHVALLGHSGSVGVLRGADEPGDRALAVLLDERGDVTSVLSVQAPGTQSSNHSNSEFSDIAPLGSDRFALLGATQGFGASYANFLYTTWAPHPGPSALFDVSVLDVKGTPAARPVVSGDTSPVEVVPARDIDVTELKTANPAP